jgi:phosphoglucosamine mutase
MGVIFERANVGDKHVLAALHARGWQMGGEPSGHLMHLGKTPAGDGIIAALQVLWAMVESGRTLADWCAGFHPYPQVLINVAVQRASEVLSSKAVQDAIAEVKGTLGGEGRVLVRASGTEPLIRVMVEAKDLAITQGVADHLAQVVGESSKALVF